MPDQYFYDYEWDEEYCYPNSNVLKNKLNIIDSEQLNNAEREITAMKILYFKKNPIAGKFDFNHLKEIHRAIFSDIFIWAGKSRNVNIAKGNMFCLSQHLDSYASSIFEKLKSENYLLEIPRENVPKRLAYYLSEINVLHPFREGNGRTPRLMIEYLAGINGFSVDYSHVSRRDMIEASAYAFVKKYDKINQMFNDITKRISLEEQEEYIRCFFGDESPQLKLFYSIEKNNFNICEEETEEMDFEMKME